MAETLTADFSQVDEIAALDQKKTSTGTIMVKRPGKIRWETKAPDKSLLVSDGKTFWFYTPPFDESEHGQVIERKSSQAQSKLAQALLSGAFSLVKDMRVEKTTDSEYVLYPRKGSAGTVQSATIDVALRDLLVEKVTLQHQGGNHSEISLSNIKLGTPLKDDLFIFTPPPGTDKVRE